MELSQSRIAARRLLYFASQGNPDSARPETALVRGSHSNGKPHSRLKGRPWALPEVWVRPFSISLAVLDHPIASVKQSLSIVQNICSSHGSRSPARPCRVSGRSSVSRADQACRHRKNAEGAEWELSLQFLPVVEFSEVDHEILMASTVFVADNVPHASM
jgi:hypothetical protein